MMSSQRETEERLICLTLLQLLSRKLHADGFLGIVLPFSGSSDEGCIGDAVACNSTELPELTEQLVWDEAELAFEDVVHTALLSDEKFAKENGYSDWLVENTNTNQLNIIGSSGRFFTIAQLLTQLLESFIPWGYENNGGGAGILFLNTATGEVFMQFGAYETVLNIAAPVKFSEEAVDGLVCESTKGESADG